MNRGMRHVIGGAALAAGILLQAAPAFAQVPPWAQQRQRRVTPQLRASSSAPPQPTSSSRLASRKRSNTSSRQQQAQPQQKPQRRSPFAERPGARGVPEQGHAASRADRGLHRGDRRRPRQAGACSRRCISIAATPIARRAISTTRSRISARRSISTARTPTPISAAPRRYAPRASSTTRIADFDAGDQARSAGTRRSTAPAATPITRSATTTAPSPT